MRRYWREQQPRHMFRSSELMRLMAGIFMLGLICLLMVRFRDPSMWQWAAGKAEKPTESADRAAPQPSKPAAALPAATGPTDEDPDQADMAREEFQALTDGTLQIQREEMEPYDRLLEWVKHQSFDRLYRRAKKGLRYTDLYDDTEKHRGELVALDVEIRMAGDAGTSRYGIPLHDAWGVTDESRGRLYSLIVVDYPKGMPVGFDICEKAKFAGYFLKLQGYEPGSAKPGQAPDKAPLLIGRLQWQPAPAAKQSDDARQEWIWGLGILAVIASVVVLNWVVQKLFRRKTPARPAMMEVAGGEVIPIEMWLERSNLSATDAGDQSREEHESLDGDGKPDGHFRPETPRFPDGLDGG
jgi:hypothetical protein